MKTMRARCIVGGNNSRGEVLFSSGPIAFLQGVDPEKGVVSDQKSEIYDVPFRRRILVFPNAIGSSVGAYVIYRLKKNRTGPKAIINQNADIITASGCAIAGIPLYDLPENKISELKSSKVIFLDPNKSELEIKQ